MRRMPDSRSRPRTIPRRDLHVTLGGLLDVAMDALHADGAAIYLLDEEGDLVLEAVQGFPEAAFGHRLGPGEGLVGIVASEGRTLVSDDVLLDPRAIRRRPDWAGDNDNDSPVRAFLGAPLRAGSSVIGVLELARRRPEPFELSARGRASIFSDAAGLLIEQTRLDVEPPPAALAAGTPMGTDPIGIATLGAQLRFESAAPTFCRMLGLSTEDVIGRHAISVIPALGRPNARDVLEAALRGTPGNVGRIRLGEDLGEAFHSLALIPLGAAGSGGDGILLALQDVSARARLERQLRAEGDRAREARDRLRSAIEVITHEIRTPLTSVLGFAHLLHDRPEADRARIVYWSSQVIDKARLMARLMQEVTELARVGSGFALTREPFDLPALARTVATDVGSRAAKHEIDVWVADGVPQIVADPDRIEQVLVNLLNNAIKFWPAGGNIEVRIVTAEGGAIPDGPLPSEPAVDVAVVDHGPGVPEDAVERIFEPFQRLVDASEVGGVPGTGLGLAVCREIIEAHGGHITYEPTPGGGATFRFRVPIDSSAGVDARTKLDS